MKNNNLFNSDVFTFSKKLNEFSVNASMLENLNEEFDICNNENLIIESNKTKNQVEFEYNCETRNIDLKLIVVTYKPTKSSILKYPNIANTVLNIFNI